MTIDHYIQDSAGELQKVSAAEVRAWKDEVGWNNVQSKTTWVEHAHYFVVWSMK